MARLLLFNPEHDYALANGGPFYIAPASVRKLANNLQLLPLIWAHTDDLILGHDNSFYNSNGKRYTCFEEVNNNIQLIEPWGWNEALKHRLKSLQIHSSLLPDSEYIDTLRRLSHRRISINCNEFLDSSHSPREFFDPDEAEEYALNHTGCFFKLPWSSGGRGVVSTKELNKNQIREWVTGAIKKQGSVMAEPGIDRVLDFASLWDIVKGESIFKGFSISISDGRGKYKGNVFGEQELINDYLKKFAYSFSMNLIDKQKNFISKFISPFYNGKLGIDMVCDKEGRIYPCIEINMRRTMGHVALDYAAFLKKSNVDKLVIKDLPLINIKELI